MVKASKRSQVRLLGVTGCKRSDLLRSTALQAATLLVLSVPAMAQPAPNARPLGGVVVAGGAAISQTARDTAINQTTQRAAINWQSFNVGSQQGVTFNQPSPGAMALNRVVGPDPSQIAGRITANGQIVLVNQAGVTFYQGSQVNAQSLIVTTANISNKNFMAGNMTFDRSRNPNASVTNDGEITVAGAGLAALVAPRVANSGTINARLGHVVLAGAKTATLDLYGDGLLALDVSNQVTQAPVGPNGKQVTALVTNTGVIRADGGTVQLTAAAADGVLRNLVNAGGTIAAHSVGAQTGTVTIAGMGGSVSVTGLVSVSGRAPDTMGGQVAVNATGNVTLASTARINASGRAGGGAVAIGTTLQRASGGPGTPSAMTAANVDVRPGARITASATRSGNGGRVTVLSGQTTRMDGTIVSRGGPQAGDGGFVEISGANLGLTGAVDVLGPAGLRGTILLDPTDLAIVASTGTTTSSVDGEFSGGTLAFTAPDGTPLPSTVSAATLNSFGANGDVIVQASGTIDVQAPVTVANGLTVQAGGKLTIESGSSLLAGGDILLQAGAVAPAGALVINDSVQSTGRASTVKLMAGTDGMTLNGNVTGTFVDLNATGGGVTQTAGVGITATSLSSTAGVTGNVSLPGANKVFNLGGFRVTPSSAGVGNFSFTNNQPLQVTGQVSATAGNVYLETSSGNGITIGMFGGVTAGGGTASFRTDSFQILGTPGIATGTVTASTFELAPATKGNTEFLGFSDVGLMLPSLANINAGKIRIGAVTPPGAGVPATTAGSIAIVGTFDSLNRNLELNSIGGITESASALVNVATLSGTGGAWDLTNPNNSVANIGNITAAGFAFNDSIDVNVGGVLNGGTFASITDVGTLTIGGTVSATSIGLTASNIAIPGLVTDGGTGTVNLVANTGSVSATGTVIAGTLSGSAAGDFSLSNAANQIQTSTGVTAANGDVIVVDGASLLLTGSYTGNSMFFQVAQPNGSLALGAGTTKAVLTATPGGRISLAADLITAISFSSMTAPGGTIELAPFSSIIDVVSDATVGFLSIISGGTAAPNTLVLGGYTNVIAHATTPSGSASGIILEGTLNLTGQATNLGLLANGPVVQTGGPVTVPNVFGRSIGSFLLTKSDNAIGRSLGISAPGGDVVLVDGSNLTLIGPHSGNNLFFEVATKGGVLQIGDSDLPASLTAGVGGHVALVADRMTENGASSLIASGGTVELAPFSAINTSLLGGGTANQLVIDPTMLSIIEQGVSLLVVGGFTNVPAGATKVAASASSITIDGTVVLAPTATTLDLEAIGPVTQSAPIVAVGTLIGHTGSTTLNDTNNDIATLGDYTATNGLALTNASDLLISGQVNSGPSANIIVQGDLTETGAITTGVLTGNANNFARLTGANVVSHLAGFSLSSDTSELILNNTTNLLIDGSLKANRIVVSAPRSQITLGDGVTIATGGSQRPNTAIPPSTLLPQNGAPGVLLQSAGFVQNGRATINGMTGGLSTLQISVTGNATFDPNAGLSGSGTWLLLGLTNGTAAGNVTVSALDVSYSQPGAANLSGIINGAAGTIAAGLGHIQPVPDTHYLFNGCEIGIAACSTAGGSPGGGSPGGGSPGGGSTGGSGSGGTTTPPGGGAISTGGSTSPGNGLNLSQAALNDLQRTRLPDETTIFVPLDGLLALIAPALVLDPEDKDDLLQMPAVSGKDY
jgi:filamentous hemagglutinin family protein